MTLRFLGGEERRVTVGALALRVEEYVREATPTPPSVPVPGLLGRDLDAGVTARWHDASALYGFLGVPSGPRQLLVVDPEGQFLPFLHAVVVPDRRAVKDALEAGTAPPTIAPAWPVRLARPSRVRAVPSGQSVVDGAVVDTAGRPVAFAVVRLRIEAARLPGSPAGLEWAGLTDAMGAFRLWLRDLPYQLPDEDEGGHTTWAADLTVRARTAGGPVDPTKPEQLAAALHPDFDTLLATRSEATFYGGPTTTVPVTVPYGAPHRVPTLTLA